MKNSSETLIQTNCVKTNGICLKWTEKYILSYIIMIYKLFGPLPLGFSKNKKNKNTADNLKNLHSKKPSIKGWGRKNNSEIDSEDYCKK